MQSVLHHKSQKSSSGLILVSRFKRSYNGNQWVSGGSGVMTPTLRRVCGIDPAKDGKVITSERYSADKCKGLQVK